MATRSRIAVEVLEGKVKSVYCHYDGYYEGVGAGLMEMFPDGTQSEQVEDFINEGDRSTLDTSYKEWRGEDCPFDEVESVSAFFEGDIEEYGYLYTAEGQWLVKRGYGQSTPVTLESKL